MPKTPKTPPKTKPKTKRKDEPEPQPVSITSKKWYWVSVTVIMSVFGSVYGYVAGLPFPNIVLMVAAVLAVIGFAAYIKLRPPTTLGAFKRAAFLVLGFSVIGFCLWAATVILLNAAGFQTQITVVIGENFFVITSLITCLMVGGFIGDVIGNSKDAIKAALYKAGAKIFRFKEGE